ncbi:MAG: hypothetical protein MHM6MM_002900 [Cercozoa sp. M6MM]
MSDGSPVDHDGDMSDHSADPGNHSNDPSNQSDDQSDRSGDQDSCSDDESDHKSDLPSDAHEDDVLRIAIDSSSSDAELEEERSPPKEEDGQSKNESSSDVVTKLSTNVNNEHVRRLQRRVFDELTETTDFIDQTTLANGVVQRGTTVVVRNSDSAEESADRRDSSHSQQEGSDHDELGDTVVDTQDADYANVMEMPDHFASSDEGDESDGIGTDGDTDTDTDGDEDDGLSESRLAISDVDTTEVSPINSERRRSSIKNVVTDLLAVTTEIKNEIVNPDKLDDEPQLQRGDTLQNVILPRALNRRKRQMPHDSKGRPFPIWKFAARRFRRFGLGIYLYFTTLQHLAMLFAILSLVHLPILAMYANNGSQRLARADSTFSVEYFSMGHLGAQPNTSAIYLNTTTSDNLESDILEFPFGIDVAGVSEVSRADFAFFVACVDVASTLILFLGIRFMRKRHEKEVHDFRRKIVTAANFAVEVQALPRSKHTTRENIANHFTQFGTVRDVALICLEDIEFAQTAKDIYDLDEKRRAQRRLKKKRKVLKLKREIAKRAVMLARERKNYLHDEEELDVIVSPSARRSKKNLRSPVVAFVTFESQV